MTAYTGAPRVTARLPRPVVPGRRRRLAPLKDRLDSGDALSLFEPAERIPIPKYVPLNTHVPGTIALAFFTHRGFCRP
jgi:hypothetical protein